MPMTATIHPHPRARKTPGAGYPAAFGSAAGPAFQWSVPTQPVRAVASLPLRQRTGKPEAGLGRLVRLAAR